MAENKVKTLILSVVPMRTQVVFPDLSVAFDAGRGISLAAVERANLNDKLIFLTKQKDAQEEVPGEEGLFAVGTVARVRQVTRLPGDRIRVFANTLYRARARDFRIEGGYIYAVTDELTTIHGDPTLEEAYFRTAKELVKDVIQADGKISQEVDGRLATIGDIDEYINVCAYNMRIREEVKQQLLEETRLVETLVLLSKNSDSHINVTVEFGEGEGQISLKEVEKRAEARKPKEKVTYKMIQQYIEEHYGFMVHTAYIAEVKRSLGLPMYDAPNAVEELKRPRSHPTEKMVLAIKETLAHFEII